MSKENESDPFAVSDAPLLDLIAKLTLEGVDQRGGPDRVETVYHYRTAQNTTVRIRVEIDK